LIQLPHDSHVVVKFIQLFIILFPSIVRSIVKPYVTNLTSHDLEMKIV
jgi:hypothetical protein